MGVHCVSIFPAYYIFNKSKKIVALQGDSFLNIGLRANYYLHIITSLQ